MFNEICFNEEMPKYTYIYMCISDRTKQSVCGWQYIYIYIYIYICTFECMYVFMYVLNIII